MGWGEGAENLVGWSSVLLVGEVGGGRVRARRPVLAGRRRRSRCRRSAAAMMSATSVNSGSSKPRVASAGVPIRRPEDTIGGRGSIGTALRLTVMPIAVQPVLGLLAVELGVAQVDQHQVHVGPAGQHAECRAAPASGGRSRSASSALRTGCGCCRSTKSSAAAHVNATALPAMTCSSGPPCRPGKTAELIFLAIVGVVGEDDAAARAAEGLVRGGGDDVGERHGVGVQAGGDQPGEVRHVDDQVARRPRRRSARNRREVELAGVGRPAGDDHASAGARGPAARPRPCRRGRRRRRTP